METKHIIIGLIIILVVLFLMQKNEHASGSVPATGLNLSNEAIQNIAKVYADTNNEAVFNNLKATGNATINGVTTLKGATTVDGDTLFNGNTTFKSSVAGMPSHLPFSDGKNYIRGPTQIDGAATFNQITSFKGVEGVGQTHFPWVNGENYIRGTTNIDGHVNFNNGITYRGHPLVNCNWVGERAVLGDRGCEDDIFINCQNNKVVNFRFSC